MCIIVFSFSPLTMFRFSILYDNKNAYGPLGTVSTIFYLRVKKRLWTQIFLTIFLVSGNLMQLVMSLPQRRKDLFYWLLRHVGKRNTGIKTKTHFWGLINNASYMESAAALKVDDFFQQFPVFSFAYKIEMKT